MTGLHFWVPLVLALAACGVGDSSPTPTPPAAEAPAKPASRAPAENPADVARLARAARAVAVATDDASATLALQVEGFTLESYEATLFEVAADPTKAAAFSEARK